MSYEHNTEHTYIESQYFEMTFIADTNVTDTQIHQTIDLLPYIKQCTGQNISSIQQQLTLGSSNPFKQVRNILQEIQDSINTVTLQVSNTTNTSMKDNKIQKMYDL